MAAVIVGGAIATIPSAAQAAWPGTPGKVAYLERKSGEFDLELYSPKGVDGTTTTIKKGTFHFPDLEAGDRTSPTNGLPSAPAWSPDGTRLAFAAKVPDPSLAPDATHTAIFVWTLKSGDITQLTFPPAGRPQPADDGRIGRVFADYSPAWAPDGKSVAYVRLIKANPGESVYPQQGGNVRIVRADGSGGDVALTHRYGEFELYHGLAWGGDPKGETHLVSVHTSPDSGLAIVEINPVTGKDSVLESGPLAALTRDFDVDPSGRYLDMLQSGGSAVRREFGNAQLTAMGSGYVGDMMRSSPTGNGQLHVGYARIPGGPLRAGLIEYRAPDPDGDVWEEESRDRWVNGMFRMDGKWAYGTVGRSAFDVQPQQLPIISLPGFAGSTILCGGETVWPPRADLRNGQRLRAMTLDADGRTNANCPGAGPTEDPDADNAFVSTAIGKEIYAPQERFIERIAPGDRGWKFSWDWRKRPADSIERLDTFITRVLGTDFAKAQGVDRVVLYGHSYGGLLMREYVDSHADRVARTLTAGTPYLGVPKPTFFVSFGVENPLSGLADLDTLLPNAEATAFARNAAGVYHLFAADHYGRWMRPIGKPDMFDLEQTRGWLTNVAGANGALFDQAQAWHRQYDGFTTKSGLIEARAVIGRGLLSIGAVEVPEGPDASGEFETKIEMIDGDITVPVRSANQGELGTHTPLGDPVHVQSVCGIKHMSLGGANAVTDAYEEYLLRGRTPRKTPVGSEEECTATGTTLEVRRFKRAGAGRRGRAAADVRTIAPTPSLVEASQNGDLQLIEVPGNPIAVVQDNHPVDVQLASGDEAVTVVATRWNGETRAETRTYTGLLGDVRVQTGAGGALAMTVDGRAVQPDGAPSGGSGGSGAGGSGGASGGAGAGGSSGGPGSGGSGAPQSTGTLKLTSITAVRSGRQVRVRVRGQASVALRVRVSAGRVSASRTIKRGRFDTTLPLRTTARRVTVAIEGTGIKSLRRTLRVR